METALQRIVLLTAVAIAAPAVGFGLESTTHVWTFNDDAPKTLPAAFQVGTLFDGRPAGSDSGPNPMPSPISTT